MLQQQLITALVNMCDLFNIPLTDTTCQLIENFAAELIKQM